MPPHKPSAPSRGDKCQRVANTMEFNHFVQLIADDDGNGVWGKFIPFIVLMILYSLGGLLKKKEQEKKQQQRPTKPKPRQREQDLPTYSRPKPQPQSNQPADSAASRPKPAPRSAQPGPSKPRPKPTSTRQPAQPTPTPIEIIPEPVARKPQPIHVHPTPRKPSKAIHRPAEFAHEKDHAKLKSQMPLAAKTAASQRPSQQKEKSGTTSRKNLVADRLDLALDRNNALVRAIVYAEILGKPTGLKSSGGYEFL